MALVTGLRAACRSSFGPSKRRSSSAGRRATCTTARGHRGLWRRRAAACRSRSARFKTRILATDMFPVDKPAYVEALWPADRLDDLLARGRRPDSVGAA